MTCQVVITSKAKIQLAESARWWAEHRSAEQAAKWLDGFEAAISELRFDPQHHRLAPESSLYDLPFPVRQMVHGIGKRPTHRALFEIRGDTVFVVAIRHLAQADLSVDELTH